MPKKNKGPSTGANKANQNKHDDISTELDSFNLLFFPVHKIPTISSLVREYRLTHIPRGNYKTPLPNDYRRGVR